MASSKSKRRNNRRDRRLAKQSGFAREGTKKPKKCSHHAHSGVPSRYLGRTVRAL